MGHTTLLKYEILTGNSPPVQCRPYRTSPKMKAEIERQLDEMLKYGIIEESVSNNSSPIVMVKRKTTLDTKNPELRLCVDYRGLNSRTETQKTPTPRMDHIIDALGQTKPTFLGVLDLFSGYWQCEVHENSRHKKAFVTSDRHLQFRRLPFGLKNSPSFFVTLTNTILRSLTGKCCSIYIDDIIVWSQTFEEHLNHLSHIFDRFKKENLKLKPTKCHFAKPDVLYLGHIISKDGIKVDPSKTDAVKNFLYLEINMMLDVS